MNAETINIAVEVKHATDAAVLVWDGDKEVWLPRSQVFDSDGPLAIGNDVVIVVPVWLAENKGLV